MKNKKKAPLHPSWKNLFLIFSIFLFTFVLAILDFFIKRIVILPSDLALYLFYHFVIHFFYWGFFIFIVVLVYKCSLVRGNRKILDKKGKIASLVLGFVLLFLGFYISTYQAIPRLRQQERVLEKKAEYANLFYRWGEETYEVCRSNFDSFIGNEIEQLSLIEYEKLDQLLDALENYVNQYLYYDKKLNIDGRQNNNILQVQNGLSAWQFKMKSAQQNVQNLKSLDIHEKYRAVDEANALLQRSYLEYNLIPAIESYQIYVDCLKRNPSDVEFIEGLTQSKKRIDELVFYRSEIEFLFEYPYLINFSMQNRKYIDKYGNCVSESVSAERLVRFRNQFYFKNIEVVGRNSETGKELYRLTSDFAQKEQDQLIFRSLKQRIRLSELCVASVSNLDYSEYAEMLPFDHSEMTLSYFSEGGDKHLFSGIATTIGLLRQYQKGDRQFDELWAHLIYLIVELLLILTIPIWIVIMSLEIKSKGGFNHHSKQYFIFPIAVFGVYILYSFLELTVQSAISHLVKLLGFGWTLSLSLALCFLFCGSVVGVYLFRKRKNRI